MGYSNMGIEMVFWRGQQHFGALDALQSGHDNSTLDKSPPRDSLLTLCRVGHPELVQQSPIILQRAAPK